MNKPILIILIGYIIGIIWGIYFNISIFFIFLSVIAIYLKKKEKTKILLLIVISALISNISVNILENQYKTKFQNIENIETSGIIISNKEEKEHKNRYKIKICEGQFKNTRLYIMVDKRVKLEYGDKIELKGEFEEPKTARNYKGFNYKEYLKTIKIYGTIKVDKVEIQKKNQCNLLMIMSNKTFLKIKENIQKTYNEQTQGIILGIMLGDKTGIDEEIEDNFSESNISHILAVSGMHVTYIIYLVSNSKYIFGKTPSKIISSIFLIVYMFITGFSVSVVRACIMGIISCMAFVVHRKSDTINNIAISAMIILLNNPYSLFSLSFQLTFGGTIGIVLFQEKVNRILVNKIKLKKISEILSVSVSAQIIIAPIILLNFNTIGIAFLITNLLLNVVIGSIVMGGLIQIIISFITINIGIIIAKVIQLPIYMLIMISEIGGIIPFGNIQVITPNFYQVSLYYILVFFYKKIPKKIIIILIIISILSSFIVLPHDLKIYFIDVEQGDSSLIITPNNKKILIDGGGSTTYDVGKNVLVPYLLDRGIYKLDYIFVSHMDQDHVRTVY